MTSPPLKSTHDRQRRTWHDISAVGQHTRSDDVRCGMPSSPLDSTQGGTTSGRACDHRLWAAKTVERRLAWHAIITVGLAHTVGRCRNLNKEELTEIFKVAYRNLRGPLFHTKHNVYIKREHSKNCSGEEFLMLKLKN